MVPGIPLLGIFQDNIEGGISFDPYSKVRKWILLGGRGDWHIELSGIEAFVAAPEFIKLGPGDLCPVSDGSSLDLAKGTIDPDCLEHILEANREGVTRPSTSKKARESQSAWLRRSRSKISEIPPLFSAWARLPSVGCLSITMMT